MCAAAAPGLGGASSESSEYIRIPSPIWRRWFMQTVCRAFALAVLRTGNMNAARIAMTATATKSSISVRPAASLTRVLIRIWTDYSVATHAGVHHLVELLMPGTGCPRSFKSFFVKRTTDVEFRGKRNPPLVRKILSISCRVSRRVLGLESS